MKQLDILTPAPSIFMMNESKGKNKLGGFFSIILFLTMMAAVVYYLYNYFSGLEYSLIYYNDNFYTKLTAEQKEKVNKEKSFIFYIPYNRNNATISFYLENGEGNGKKLEKCGESNGYDYFCVNLPFLHFVDPSIFSSIHLYCEENCFDSNGNPSTIGVYFYTNNLKIDHDQKNPFPQTDDKLGDILYLTTNNNIFINYLIKFTPILYESTEIFDTKSSEYVTTYLSSVENRIIFQKSYSFAAFNLVIDTNCDIYKREYITLIDTISNIGGIYSPINLFFSLLIMFYSDFQNNSEITKNVFLKRDKYNYKIKNNISIEKHLENESKKEEKIEIQEKNLDEKLINEKNDVKIKLNVNKFEQFFCGMCKCYRNHRSMKILNLCNEFVQNYLSAENIIFNMVLFENYYKENPIRIISNYHLDQIEKEIEPNFIRYNYELKNKINDE